MKKIKRILLTISILIGMVLFPNMVYAASSSINVSSNKTTAIVGNTFTVTVSVNASGDKLGSWEYSLNYDSSLFKVMSGTTPVVDYGDGSKTKATYTYSIKALKSGSGAISVKSYDVIGWDSESSLNPSASGVTVKCMTQSEVEATYSANADLKGLTVEGYELTPAFDKNTLEYSLELENNITSINVGATKADNRSEITGTGAIALIEGANRIEIIVTAQKGNTKTYVINANVKELDPITIKVDGVEYKIIRKADQLDAFTSFQAKVITYEENDIPALYNEIIKYTIIGAKDEAGNKLYFKYDEKAKTFTRYQEIKFEGAVFNPLTTDKKPLNEKYKATTIKINGVEVKAYKINKKSEFALIYGVNVEDGHEGFYLYDAVGNTIQRYNAEEFTLLNQDIKYYFIVIIAFGIGLFLSFALVFAILYTKSKNKKKKDAIKEKLVEQPETIDNKGKKKDIKQINNVKEAKEKLKEIKQKAEASEETEEMFQLLEKK